TTRSIPRRVFTTSSVACRVLQEPAFLGKLSLFSRDPGAFFFHQLHEHSTHGVWVKERDFVATRTRSWRVVDQLYPAAFQVGERGFEPLDFDRQVVKPGAALFEKALDRPTAFRGDDLDFGALTRTAHLDEFGLHLLRLDVLV